MFAEIDKKLRIGFSLLYRVIISLYLLLILYCEEGWAKFPWSYYIMIIPLYLFMVFIIKSRNGEYKVVSKSRRDKEKIKAFIRLIIDYSVIIWFLKGYDINHFQNYFILILPLINSINHSMPDSKNTVVYFAVIISILYLDNWELHESKLIPVFILFFIIQFFMIRQRISSYKDKLFQIIDEFYGTNATKKEMTFILAYISNQLNTSLKGIRFGDLAIKNISCYKQKGNDLILISSGQMVEKYQFDSPEKLIRHINSKNRKVDVGFKVNGENQPFNFVFKAKGNKYSYIYVITFDKPILILNSIFALRLIVEPSFRHLSKLLEIKWTINSEKSKLYNEVRKKHEYVIKSMEVLHFVKGALSPFSILNDSINLYKNDADNERKARTLEKIFSLSSKSNANIKMISKRAEMIYDKSANPFISNNIDEHTFSELFSWIRRVFEETTNSKNVILQKETNLDTTKVKIDYDEELFQAVLIEIFENINKHAGLMRELEFLLEDKKISISFKNNLLNLSNKKIEEIKKNASKHNTDSRPSINQRDSERFGFYIMKDYLYQMNMKSRISINSDNIYSHTIIITTK